jgi:hypothetical protein
VIVIGPLVIGALPSSGAPTRAAYRNKFESETLVILEIAFNEVWEFRWRGGDFDQKATRDVLAELIMSCGAEGEQTRSRTSIAGFAPSARNTIKLRDL